ncbi:MAG TPA: insulinase family protein, partial [bacterium]|nr:insulinase family protein [bacterium]
MNRRLIALASLTLVAACGPKPVQTAKPGAAPAASPAASAAATVAAAAPSPTPEVTPIEPDIPFPAADAFREKQPAPGPTPSFKQPKVQTFKLPGGTSVWLVERHELPTVELTLYLDGGTMDDPAGKEGQVALCADLLTEGTTKLDRLGYDAALADLGSSVGSFASADEVGVNMRSLTKNLDATLDLWADALLSPRLDAEELGRDVKTRKEGLRSIRANPSAIAGRLANGIVFGPEHGYGRIDTEASLGAISIDDCRAFAKGLSPKGAKLFVVGDITRAQIEEKVGKRLAPFKGAGKAHAKPGVPAPRKGRVFFVDVPGA